MYFLTENIAIDYDRRPLVSTDSAAPVFTWAARHSRDGARQSAYAVTVTDGDTCLWDSGWVQTTQQRAVYGGVPLESGRCCTVTVRQLDDRGQESTPARAAFRYLGQRQWQGKWITTAEEAGTRAKYFYRDFALEQLPVSATLYVCGIGYQYVTVNGVDVERSFLNPAVSHYGKHCYYTVTDVTDAGVHFKLPFGIQQASRRAHLWN